MGLDITNNKSGKSPYALVIYCNNNLNILIVVIMMRMTWTSFMKFLLKVDMSIKKHLSSWRKQKGCHGDDNKTVPRQRPGSDNSLRRRCKRKCGGSVQKMVGWSRLSGVPRIGDKETSDNLDTVQNPSISNIASIHSRTSSQGYTFEACKRDSSRSVQRRGSRCSRTL